MKKLISVAIAVAMVFSFAMTASAAEVQVTLTSPTITKAAGSCEKAGAVTFEFPPGSILNDGDWWYMDLPPGATLCKDIDYVIGGQIAAGVLTANSYAAVDSLDPTVVVGAANYQYLGVPGGVLAPGGTGPVQLTVTTLPGTAAGVVGNLSIRVIGESGSRRVTLYVADQITGLTGNGITVNADTVLTVKILDGAAHVANGDGVDSSRILTDVNGQRYATASNVTPSDIGQYFMFGEAALDGVLITADEQIDVATFSVPHVENTLCVNAETAVGNLNVSFASKNDEFTFSGDSQIAHEGGGTIFSLEACSGKTASTDEILLAEQDECIFDYEDSAGYCPTHDNGFIYLHAGGGTFGEIDDLYDMEIQVVTAGVYFGNGAVVNGILASQTVCEAGGTAVLGAGDWIPCVGSDCTSISYPGDNACDVDSDDRVDRIYTEGGEISVIQNYTDLVYNFDDFHYDTSIVAAGDEVDLDVTVSKYPCGEIWSGTITIGTFVESCGGATGASTLLFPWLPGSTFVGWWAGYVVTNGGGTAGTAMLTATDSDGNSATYTTASIPAAGFFNASFLSASDWTQASGNSANFDGSLSYIVSVACNFSRGAGFAMLGNSVEGVGYTAETTAW